LLQAKISSLQAQQEEEIKQLVDDIQNHPTDGINIRRTIPAIIDYLQILLDAYMLDPKPTSDKMVSSSHEHDLIRFIRTIRNYQRSCYGTTDEK
jgi:hypothetical protein